jgi:hypothetical protein
MVTAIKGRSAQITKLVDSLPVPDSVKSFVHDPKSVLPKSAQDLLDNATNALNQPSEPADLENAEQPKAAVVAQTPKSILKKDSRVTIAPTPTFSDDVVLDGGIQLTNRQPRTQTQPRAQTQPRTPMRNTIMNDTYDVYDTDNIDNAYENTLIHEPAQSSGFVRNPGSFGPQGGSFRSQGGSTYIRPNIPTPILPEGCKCEACLAAKAAHEPPPPSVSTADVMKQLEDLKKFMVEQMKPVAPVAHAPVEPAPVVPVAPVPVAPAPITVPVSTSEPAERLPKIVYPENSWSNTLSTNQEPIYLNRATPIVEAPAAPVTEVKVAEVPVTETHELDEIRALLAERQKKII